MQVAAGCGEDERNSAPRFEAIGKLGSGAYAVVLRAKDARGGVVALKKLNNIPRNPAELAVLLQEAIILKAAAHPNIVKILDAYQSSSGRVYLVLEHLEKTLSKELLFKPQGLPIPHVKLVMWQTLQAVAFLHEQGILHRDLKPENILISSQGIVKICDFGFAKFTQEGSPDDASPYAITRWYRAPEVLVMVSEHSGLKRGDPYGPGVDVWALGCVMASLATGHALMPGVDRADQLRQIACMVGPLTEQQTRAVAADAQLSAAFQPPAPGDMGQLEKRLSQLPGDAVAVIRACLQVDPLLRPSASELLHLPFFSDVQVPAELAEQLEAVKATARQDQALHQHQHPPPPLLQETRSMPLPVLSPGRSGSVIDNAPVPLTPELTAGPARRSGGGSLLGKALSSVSPMQGCSPRAGGPEAPAVAAAAAAAAAATALDSGWFGAPGAAAAAAAAAGPSGGSGLAAWQQGHQQEQQQQQQQRHALRPSRQLLFASPVYRPLMAQLCTPLRTPRAPTTNSAGGGRGSGDSSGSGDAASPPAATLNTSASLPVFPLKRCTTVVAGDVLEGATAAAAGGSPPGRSPSIPTPGGASPAVPIPGTRERRRSRMSSSRMSWDSGQDSGSYCSLSRTGGGLSANGAGAGNGTATPPATSGRASMEADPCAAGADGSLRVVSGLAKAGTLESLHCELLRDGEDVEGPPPRRSAFSGVVVVMD